MRLSIFHSTSRALREFFLVLVQGYERAPRVSQLPIWEHINELESDEQIPDGATEIDGTLSKYISFWLTEDKIDVTLLFVEDNDGNTHIYAEDNTCNNCNSSVFGKTIGDYIKLYEDMHLNSQVYDDFNVAYLISEASS